MTHAGPTTKSTAKTAQAGPKDRSRPSRIGFEGLLEVLDRYRAEARCANELDRRHLLFRLGAELELEENELLRRGFDKAYRRIVEGV